VSDYNEHLISMAGGDGDALDQIQRRSDVAMDYPGMVTIEQSQADIPALLAMVREQRAALEAAKAEAWAEGWAHYRKHFSPNFPEFGINPYRATEDAS